MGSEAVEDCGEERMGEARQEGIDGRPERVAHGGRDGIRVEFNRIRHYSRRRRGGNWGRRHAASGGVGESVAREAAPP